MSKIISKRYDTWKIQLTVAINFNFFKETHEERVMYSRVIT